MTPEPQRILLIRPSALGDVCRTVPVLSALRRRYPAARIDWLVRDVFSDAIAAHPALNNVIPFPRDLGRDWRKPRSAARMARWLRDLAKPNYDLVIDCQGLARSGLFALATRSRRRIGDAAAAEGAWLAYTQRVRTDPNAHVVDRALALAAAADAEPIPDMRLFAPPPMDSDASAPAINGAYVVLAPTSAWPGKCWPSECFTELGLRLLESPTIDRVVIVGAANERNQVQPLLDVAERNEGFVDLVGATSIAGLMRLIAGATLVIANDSAAMHMAVGFDRPLVALLGPTNAALAGPYRRLDSVVQVVTENDALSHRACKDGAYGSSLMQRITVNDAYAKALEQLQSAQAHHRDSECSHMAAVTP